jgi:hypothetical protein
MENASQVAVVGCIAAVHGNGPADEFRGSRMLPCLMAYYPQKMQAIGMLRMARQYLAATPLSHCQLTRSMVMDCRMEQVLHHAWRCLILRTVRTNEVASTLSTVHA